MYKVQSISKHYLSNYFFTKVFRSNHNALLQPRENSFRQNLNLQRQAVNALLAGKSSLTNEMITQSKQQTRNTQTTCQKLLCTHPAHGIR